jgi:sigma-B regulation protein RsbU (phosphoserine phosphatase)
VCVQATKGLDNENGRLCSEKALSVFLHTQLQQPFLVEDWHKDEYVNQYPWPAVNNLPCYIALPLVADNHMTACVQLFAPSHYLLHYDAEKKLLNTLASHTAVCHSNAMHYTELRNTARVEAELDAARDIQRSFTPHGKPDIPHIDLMGISEPAYQVGGDYVDYFKTVSGHWVVVVADVCGKGIPAALLMTHLRSTFRFEAQGHTSAKDLMCEVSRSMLANLDAISFVTAICCIISPDGQSMSYARAGHPPIIHIGAISGDIKLVESQGLALGLTRNEKMFVDVLQEITIPLVPGEAFFLYTDGLTEAADFQKKLYGTERLISVLSSINRTSAEAIVTAVRKDVVEIYSENNDVKDDLTMLAMVIR